MRDVVLVLHVVLGSAGLLLGPLWLLARRRGRPARRVALGYQAAVDDPAAAREFYGALFGFSWEEVPGVEGYATFTTGDRPLGGLGGAQPGLPRGWSTCFAVASCDEAVSAVEAGGQGAPGCAGHRVRPVRRGRRPVGCRVLRDVGRVVLTSTRSSTSTSTRT